MIALAEAELPSAPIWNIAEASTSDHAKARGLVTWLPHSILGTAPVVAQPVQFDEIKPVADTSAPAHGADGAAVLQELCGVDAVRLEELKEAGVVA